MVSGGDNKERHGRASAPTARCFTRRIGRWRARTSGFSAAASPRSSEPEVPRMLSPRAIYGEIFRNDEAFRLFCSIAASGEAQGGWENGRIAALVPESCRNLAPKIARHGADEVKHGRIFYALLRKRSLYPAPVPADTDYTMRLEGMGIGLAHSKLRADRQLTEADIIAYLAHSRVTEQRASEQMRLLHRCSTDNADVRRAVAVIS